MFFFLSFLFCLRLRGPRNLRGAKTISLSSSLHSDKPKKTIKKKPLSTKAKIRKEKTLERGLMNAEKDVKRIDKHHEKVTLKKRGKQMWE